MTYKIKISSTAFSDIQSAINYYNKVQTGLGKKFKLAIGIVFNQLKNIPASGSFLYENIRYRVVKKFPFIIVYEIIEEKYIYIYRIFNANRNPFWM